MIVTWRFEGLRVASKRNALGVGGTGKASDAVNEFSGKTVNERLFAVDLLDDFDPAARLLPTCLPVLPGRRRRSSKRSRCTFSLQQRMKDSNVFRHERA